MYIKLLISLTSHLSPSALFLGRVLSNTVDLPNTFQVLNLSTSYEMFSVSMKCLILLFCKINDILL